MAAVSDAADAVGHSGGTTTTPGLDEWVRKGDMAAFIPASGTSASGATATASATWCAEGAAVAAAAATPTE